MSDEYNSLKEELNKVKTKIAVTDYFVNSFKEQDVETLRRLESLKERVLKLETSSYNQFKDLERVIDSRIESIEKRVIALNKSLTPVAENSLLQFTNNMDVKKWTALISIIISVLASAGILDNLVSSNVRNDSNEDLTNRLEELLELSE